MDVLSQGLDLGFPVNFVDNSLLGRARLEFLDVLTETSGLGDTMRNREGDTGEPESLRSFVNLLRGLRRKSEEFNGVEL